MSNKDAPQDNDHRPAVGGPVQRQVRPLVTFCPCGDVDCDKNRAVAINATVAMDAKKANLRAVAVELERLMLVIESAVRHADPRNHAAVMALILANKAALADLGEA